MLHVKYLLNQVKTLQYFSKLCVNFSLSRLNNTIGKNKQIININMLIFDNLKEKSPFILINSKQDKYNKIAINICAILYEISNVEIVNSASHANPGNIQFAKNRNKYEDYNMLQTLL